MNTIINYHVALMIVGTLSVSVTSYFLIEIAFNNYLMKILSKSSKLIQKFNKHQLAFFLTLLTAIVVFFWDFNLGFLILFFSIFLFFFIKNAPAWIRKQDTNGKQKKLNQLFPQTLGMAIQALKTGQTLPQVIEYLSRECPTPLKDELTIVCAEMNLGSSAEQALTRMAERFPDFLEFHQFLESYKISRQTGANLTHLLQVLLDGVEEKSRIFRKMDAMTAQARLSGLLIGLLPVLLGIVFFFMDPNLIIPLFTQKVGWGILLIASLLETIGFLWIRQLLRLEI